MTDSPQGSGAVSAPADSFPIGFVAHKKAPVSKRAEHTWPSLIAMLAQAKPGPKDGPAWLPADIDPGPRTATRARSWSTMVMDIEAHASIDATGAKTVDGPEPPPLDAMADEIRDIGWRAHLHTSHTHLDPEIRPLDQDHARYRIVFALDRPLLAPEIKPLLEHLARMLGVSDCYDKGCFNADRLFYLPRAPAERLELFQSRTIEGEPLPVARLLAEAQREAEAIRREAGKRAAAPESKRKGFVSTQNPSGPTGADVIRAFNDVHDIGALLERHGYLPKGRGRWLSPQSSSGAPGVRLLSETGKIISSHDDALNDGHVHDAFDVFKILEHGGNQTAAIRAASKLLGMDRKRAGATSGEKAKRSQAHGKNMDPPSGGSINALSHEEPPPAPPDDGDPLPPALPPESLRLGNYLWKSGIFYQIRTTTERYRDPDTKQTVVEHKDTFTALANFSAIVSEQRQRDDGDATESHTLMRVFRPRGGFIGETSAEVLTERFTGLGWVTPQLGHEYVVTAGNSIRDHLRAAIQTFSGHFGMRTRRVYTHTGWREIDGDLCYLHAGGAITAQGLRSDLDVELDDNLALYRLPEPPAPPELQTAVRATLRLLDLAPSQAGVGAYQIARIAAPPLARHLRSDCGGFVVGRTGSLKTEFAALAMAHFGEFTARALPENWETTEGALLKKAHAAKDALFEVDDYNPAGSSHDQAQLVKKADRLFRGAANGSGRGRLTSDIRLRKAHAPRGMVSASGEDLPTGRSLRARFWTVELAVGEIALDSLSACQRDAAQGLYRQTMSGYLSWLARNDTSLARQLPARHEELRNTAPAALRNHGRIPSNLALLKTAVETFLCFAHESGAIDPAERDSLTARIGAALEIQARAQCDIQEESEDSTRFVELLRSGLASGKAHVVDVTKLPLERAPAIHPEHLGWRGYRSENSEAEERSENSEAKEPPTRWEPMGERIGYVTADGWVWLDPEGCYSVVSRLARDQGAGALRTQSRLGRALIEKGYILPGDGRNVAYKHGKRNVQPARVWRMSMTRLLEVDS